jgi:hypothetical protein
MQLKPITRGGREVSPVEQIRKQNTPTVIKNGNHPATDTSELCKTCITDGEMDIISDGIIMWLTITMMNGEPEKKNSNM